MKLAEPLIVNVMSRGTSKRRDSASSSEPPNGCAGSTRAQAIEKATSPPSGAAKRRATSVGSCA